MRYIGLGAVAMLVAAAARGDVVHLKNGGMLEGQVTLTQDGAIVKLPVGEVRVSSDAIARIEKKETLLEEYLKRAAGVKEDDAEGHYKLGVWAQTVGLKAQARDEFAKTLAINPDHEGAHQALGHRKVDGRWMTPEQEMQAKGLVQRDGEWMTPEAAAKLDALKAELEAAKAKREAAEAELRKAQEQPAYTYGSYYSTRPAVSSYPYYTTSPYVYATPYASYYYVDTWPSYYYVRPYPYIVSCWPRVSFSFGWHGGRYPGHRPGGGRPPCGPRPGGRPAPRR